MGGVSRTTATKPGPKAPFRRCPEDFDVIFVEQGRIACESWYRASRITVNRWLDERGKRRLIQLRADYVASLRSAGKWITRSTKMINERPKAVSRLASIRDRRKVSPQLARHAAHFLRVRRNGGWIVSPTPQGDWWVGSTRRSPAQLVDLAVARGFDVDAANLQQESEEGLGHGHG